MKKLKTLIACILLFSVCSFGQVVNGWYKANGSIKLQGWFSRRVNPCSIYTEPGEYFRVENVDSEYAFIKTITVYPVSCDGGNSFYYTYNFIIPIKEFNTPKIQRVSFLEANGFTNK